MGYSVRIAILGNSVILAGIAHALRTQDGLIIHVVNCAGELLHLLELTQPDVLIFDLESITADDLRWSVRRHDTLALVGIDIAGRQARAFSSRSYPMSTLDDLTRLIMQLAATSQPSPPSAG